MPFGCAPTVTKGHGLKEKEEKKRFSAQRKNGCQKTGARTSLRDQKKYLDPHLFFFFTNHNLRVKRFCVEQMFVLEMAMKV
jgi:hypothetical protein